MILCDKSTIKYEVVNAHFHTLDRRNTTDLRSLGLWRGKKTVQLYYITTNAQQRSVANEEKEKINLKM